MMKCSTSSTSRAAEQEQLRAGSKKESGGDMQNDSRERLGEESSEERKAKIEG
jgi:hypothetical protein